MTFLFTHLPSLIPKLSGGHGDRALLLWIAGTKGGSKNVILKESLCILTYLVAPWGISLEASLCFTSLRDLSGLKWLLGCICQNHLKTYTSHSHLGQGMVEGASSRQTKKPERRYIGEWGLWRAPAYTSESAWSHPCPRLDTCSEKTWEDNRLSSLTGLWTPYTGGDS